MLKNLSNTYNFLTRNKMQFLGFGAAIIGSYPIGLAVSTALKHFGVSDEINVASTFVARTASFYAINLPLHKRAHFQDYLEKRRDFSKEMKVISFSNMAGTGLTLLQPPLHYYLMKKTNNTLAFLVSYGGIGLLSAGVKFGIDYFLGIMSDKAGKESRNESLEKRLEKEKTHL